MKRARVVVIACLLFAGGLAAAGDVSFRARPSAVNVGDKVKITFGVSAPTDAEVAVLDARGRVVRHLAAGMLGRNAPAPFRKNSLAQELSWDGKDDDGKPTRGARVRVRLGLRAEFDRIIGWSGQQVEDVRGLCCGPDGTLYLIYGGQQYAHRRTTLISAFDREGKYLRQVFPAPGGLPAEKRRGWPHVKLDGGREVPVVHHTLARAVYPGAVFGDRIFPTVTGDGRLVVLHSADGGFAGVSDPDFRGGRRLLIIGADGSVPENYLGPIVEPEPVTGGHGWAAVSPDNKFAYVSGLGGGKVRYKPVPLHHVVYRVALDGKGKAKPLIGKLKSAGGGKDGLNDPRGLAVDRAGNIYVADCGNNRVAIFGPAGKFLKEISVQAPWQVLVSRRTGAIYAVAEKGAKLVKLGGLKDPAVKASTPTGFKPYKISCNAMIALDDSAEPHTVWLVTRWWHGGKLRKLLDKGGSFEDLGDLVAKKLKKAAMNFTGGLAVVGGRLVTRHTDHGFNWGAKPLVFDAETGAPGGLFARKRMGEAIAGKDGLLYAIGGGWKKPFPIDRFDPSGKPLPFASGGSIKQVWHGHTRTFGLFVTRGGETYVPGGDSYRALDNSTVRRFGADGKLIDKQVVKTVSAYLGGVAVDSRGNVYLGAQIVPKGQHIPPWFDGKLPRKTKHGYPHRAYQHCGAVVKFAPAGGEVVVDPQGKYTATKYTWKGTKTVSLKKAFWLRRGGLIPRRGPKGAHCFCETSRFDIDGFDRLFVPDIHRFCVQVLDSAGNLIALIGGYGNMDNRGPQSEHPEPAIAFGWPLATQALGDRLYVADLVNRRVVAVNLKHAVEETIAVR